METLTFKSFLLSTVLMVNALPATHAVILSTIPGYTTKKVVEGEQNVHLSFEICDPFNPLHVSREKFCSRSTWCYGTKLKILTPQSDCNVSDCRQCLEQNDYESPRDEKITTDAQNKHCKLCAIVLREVRPEDSGVYSMCKLDGEICHAPQNITLTVTSVQEATTPTTRPATKTTTGTTSRPTKRPITSTPSPSTKTQVGTSLISSESTTKQIDEDDPSHTLSNISRPGENEDDLNHTLSNIPPPGGNEAHTSSLISGVTAFVVILVVLALVGVGWFRRRQRRRLEPDQEKGPETEGGNVTELERLTELDENLNDMGTDGDSMIKATTHSR